MDNTNANIYFMLLQWNEFLTLHIISKYYIL